MNKLEQTGVAPPLANESIHVGNTTRSWARPLCEGAPMSKCCSLLCLLCKQVSIFCMANILPLVAAIKVDKISMLAIAACWSTWPVFSIVHLLAVG